MKKIFDFIVLNYKNIFVFIFAIVIIILLKQCNETKSLKKEIKNNLLLYEQNRMALNDSIEIYKNKNGAQSYQKAIAKMTSEELKINFPDLYNSLKEEMGEVKYITRTEIEYRDTGSVTNSLSILDKDYYVLKSEFYNEDSTVHIKASNMFYAKTKFIDSDRSRFILDIKPDVTKYDKLSFKLGLTTGIKKDENGIYKIFITPNNPNFKITNIEGADVSDYFSKNKLSNKRFSLGPNIGYSAVFGKNNNLYHGVSVGVSLQYSLIRF